MVMELSIRHRLACHSIQALAEGADFMKIFISKNLDFQAKRMTPFSRTCRVNQ
jgi:hypothetical protein